MISVAKENAISTGVTTPIQHAKIDALEEEMRLMPPCVSPVEHFFTPGLYTRVIDMAPGSLITSKIHRTEHVFVILSGKVAVWDGEGGVQVLSAPYMGITKPGTRRVLLVSDQCRWATFHPTQHRDVSKIEEEIICPRNSIAAGEGFVQICDKGIPIQKLLEDALTSNQ